MTRNLILCGGIFHEFHASSDELARVLSPLGIESVVEDDIEAGLAALDAGSFELLTVNALRWQMQGEKYDPYRDEWAMTLSPEGRAAIAGHLDRGGAILGLHTASICFSDWPGWGDMLGGSWQWGRSWHPPPSALAVTPVDHPLMAGIAPFTVEDEVYTDLELRPGIEPLLFSVGDDQHPAQPLLWLHQWGSGRVVYDALGHDAASLREPAHSEALRRAVAWSLQISGENG
jgi:hypothetical protein